MDNPTSLSGASDQLTTSTEPQYTLLQHLWLWLRQPYLHRLYLIACLGVAAMLWGVIRLDLAMFGSGAGVCAVIVGMYLLGELVRGRERSYQQDEELGFWDWPGWAVMLAIGAIFLAIGRTPEGDPASWGERILTVGTLLAGSGLLELVGYLIMRSAPDQSRPRGRPHRRGEEAQSG